MRKVLPLGIHRLNQSIFAFSIPAFDLLFTFDGRVNALMLLEVYKLGDMISGSKTLGVHVPFVLIQPAGQVIRKAGVNGRICLIAEYVDKENSHVNHCSPVSLR